MNGAGKEGAACTEGAGAAAGAGARPQRAEAGANDNAVHAGPGPGAGQGQGSTPAARTRQASPQAILVGGCNAAPPRRHRRTRAGELGLETPQLGRHKGRV